RIAALKAVAAVYASPLERAQEAAGIIAARGGLVVVTGPGLLECDIGDWTGWDIAQAAETPQRRTAPPHPSGFGVPGGQAFVEIQTRMTTTIAALVARHPGETIVAVSHADPIKTAVAHALGTPLDLFQRIMIATASISAIAYGRSGPAVLTVNSTGGGLGNLGG